MKAVNQLGLWAAVAGAAVSIVGCGKRGSFSQDLMSSTKDIQARIANVIGAPAFDIEIWLGSTSIFSEAAHSGSTTLVFRDTNGDSFNDNIYALKLNSPTIGASYTMTIKRADGVIVVGDMTLAKAKNVMPNLEIGTYTLSITASVASGDAAKPMLSTVKNYSLTVQCGPEASNIAMDATRLSVTNLKNNVYQYDGRTILEDTYAPMQDGSLRYHCAWDFNGDGIQDSNYAPCANTVQGFSNQVTTRAVGVWVLDRQCNTRKFGKKAVNLAVPTIAAGDPYIKGTVSESGSAAPWTNLEHFSTDPTDYAARGSDGNWGNGSPVTCTYRVDSAGKGQFTVFGLYQYVTQSTQSGLSVSVGNFSDNGAAEGTLNTAGASIVNSDFRTDKDGDFQTRLEFSGGACSVNSVQMIKFKPTSMTCEAAPGSPQPYTVRADAQFQCLGMKNISSGGTSTLDIRNGSFSCEFTRGTCKGASPIPPKLY